MSDSCCAGVHAHRRRERYRPRSSRGAVRTRACGARWGSCPRTPRRRSAPRNGCRSRSSHAPRRFPRRLSRGALARAPPQAVPGHRFSSSGVPSQDSVPRGRPKPVDASSFAKYLYAPHESCSPHAGRAALSEGAPRAETLRNCHHLRLRPGRLPGPGEDPATIRPRGTERGDSVRVDLWGKRKLAYPIDKKEQGIYAVLRYETEPTSLTEFERILRLDEQVLRQLTIVDPIIPTPPAVRTARPTEEDES